jgi:glycosyltransferase involved in cell wall biosynthesis
MRLLVLTKHGQLGAASRLRVYQYLPHLRANGIEVIVSQLFNDDYLPRLYSGQRVDWLAVGRDYARRVWQIVRSRRFDLVWLEYELLPFLPAWGERLLRVPYVVHYDDAIFHNYDQSGKAIIRRLIGGKIDVVMRRAALVMAGNEYLADRARRAGSRRVELMPTVIDIDRYEPRSDFSDDRFIVGWIGSKTTTRYVRMAQPALTELARDGLSRLMLVGADKIDLPGIAIERRRWSEDTEAADVMSFDVGIMPLTDDPWSRGKCGYKLIQVMACGIPVIASPVGVNRQIVEPGVNGFLAATDAQWLDAFIRLRDDRALRARMGAAGRAQVEAHYTLQITAPRLLEWLREAVNTPA